MTIIVFTGPSLPPKDARAEIDAVFLPPVAQGDVYRVALQKPAAIGIIDGFFESVPSVWHKEILWAMARGIHVFGAASMGALRAAELEPFGMEGVGAIFEAFRDGRLEDDDEVAVSHGPMEVGYPVLCEAMVNIRRTLSDAVEQKVISAPSATRLTEISKNMYYQKRTYPAILQAAGGDDLAPGELRAFMDWLPEGKRNQKREDAIEMLRVMGARNFDRASPKRVRFAFEHTTKWEIACKLTRAQTATR
jgi:hypothetical protein